MMKDFVEQPGYTGSVKNPCSTQLHGLEVILYICALNRFDYDFK